jgi:hypothetical protein
MKIYRFVFPFFLAILFAAGLTLMRPQVVHAQCGLPGTPPCEPSGGGGGRKKPTLIPHKPIATSTPTLTPTVNPVYLTAIGCWEDIYRKTPAPELPTPSWNDIQVDAPQCLPTLTPSPTPYIFIPPVAGPVFLLPGVAVMLILVLIGLLFIGGLILVIRRRQGSR